MLKRTVLSLVAAFVASCLQAGGFKIVSYNLRHGACNEDVGTISLARQMDLVRGEKARFVALQEVEVGSSRTGGVDQLAACASLLGAEYVATFGKAIDFSGGGYGVALLSTERPLSVERLQIPDSQEDRILLICEFADCFVGTTHFSVATETDREAGLSVVRQRLRRGFGKPFFLCGDLNSTPDSKVVRGLAADFEILSPTREATYIGNWRQSDSAADTSRCIDYVLCDKANASRYGVLKRVLGPAAAVAPSDHRPIVVELTVRPGKDPDETAFVGGDWKSDRIRRGLIPEPSAADFAKAKAEWESFEERAAAWGPAPDLGEANAPAAISQARLWVAPDGNDETGDGSKARPFRGILRARDEVRKLKKGGMPADGITVFLRGGAYPMTETLAFGSADGGEAGRPVLYCAAPGEIPVLDGGFRVTGWKDFRGPVKVADVTALGYAHFEPTGPRGFEVSRESTGALVTDFYLDGVRQQPAQWPNEGWLYFACCATNNVVGIELDDWTPWLKERNLYAKMYPACFWADLTSPVSGLNPKTGTMSVYGRAQGRNQVIRRNCAFRFQNALAALDRADECVFDFAGGRLYAWDPARKDAVLSDFSKSFLHFWTAHDLEFRGLVFRYGRSDAVVADSSQRLTFRDCQFLGFGQNGIVARRMDRLTVDGCRFRDFGYHAMRVGAGDRKTLKAGRTFVQNCDVSRTGRWKADFAFAACVDGCGATLRWNRFHDVPAAAVRLNGNDMILASNVFERCDYEAGDNGAVDVYADPSYASRIIHNVFRDCGSKDRGFVEAGHAGVRLDDAVSNQIVYGNRFEGCSPTNNVEWGFGCVQINGGRNNTIENNLFVGGWRVASVSGWPMSRWTQYLANGGVQEMLRESDWQGPLYAKRYPGIDRLPTMPLVNRYYRNVQVGTGRFTALLGGLTDVRCNFAYRELPDEKTLNANPLWDPLPPESALGPRRPVVDLPARPSPVSPSGPGTFFDPRGSANVVSAGRAVTNALATKTIAFLGGSITEMHGYRPRVMALLRRRHPDVACVEIAAGLSSTCSDAAAFRLERDVLSKGTPDVLVVEESVNDEQDGRFDRAHSIRGMEGVIRKMLAVNPRCTVVVGLTVNRAQYEELVAGRIPVHHAAHRAVAERYGVPVADVGAALAESARAGGFSWKEYRDCHPSPEGCDFVARVVMRELDAAFDPLAVAAERTLPDPLDEASFFSSREIPLGSVALSEGWRVIRPDWDGIPGDKRDYFTRGEVLTTDVPGKPVTVSFEGRSLAAFVTAGPDAGDVEISIDGGEWRLHRSRADYLPLHYPYVLMIAEALPRGRHTAALRAKRPVRRDGGASVVRMHSLFAD